MSKIANRIISIPEKVKISLEKGTISAEGPLGKSEEMVIPADLEIVKQENGLITKSTNSALAGTYNALISNLIKGVVEGYQEILEVKGVGYKVVLEGNKLGLDLGKSHRLHLAHHDYVDIPADLKVTVEGGNKIIIKGNNKQKVRKFAINDIRSLRKPSVYKKSKGIYLQGEEETIKLKERKSSK